MSRELEELGAEIIDDRRRHRRVARFTCRSCPAHAEIPLEEGASSPEAVETSLVYGGWTRGPAGWLCTNCTMSRKTLDGEKPMSVHADGAPGVAPTQQAPKAEQVIPGRAPSIPEIVEIANALEAYFDKRTGRYANGKTDESIARELDMPIAWVVKVRREGFGELESDPALRQLADDLKGLQNEADGLRKACASVEAKVLGAMERLRKLEERR